MLNKSLKTWKVKQAAFSLERTHIFKQNSEAFLKGNKGKYKKKKKKVLCTMYTVNVASLETCMLPHLQRFQ